MKKFFLYFILFVIIFFVVPALCTKTNKEVVTSEMVANEENKVETNNENKNEEVCNSKIIEF